MLIDKAFFAFLVINFPRCA